MSISPSFSDWQHEQHRTPSISQRTPSNAGIPPIMQPPPPPRRTKRKAPTMLTRSRRAALGETLARRLDLGSGPMYGRLRMVTQTPPRKPVQRKKPRSNSSSNSVSKKKSVPKKQTSSNNNNVTSKKRRF